MKKQMLRYLLELFVFLGASQFTDAQTRIYVKVRPTVKVVERPAPPHKNYIWIGDEWTVRNGAYIHVTGRWVAPRRGYVWVPGHWANEPRGYYWIPGHWRRV
jgi:hypothetical protein